MSYSPALDCIPQGLNHMLLSDHITKFLWSVFTCDDLITHMTELYQKAFGLDNRTMLRKMKKLKVQGICGNTKQSTVAAVKPWRDS